MSEVISMTILLAIFAGLGTAWVLASLAAGWNARRAALQPVPVRTSPGPHRVRRRLRG